MAGKLTLKDCAKQLKQNEGNVERALINLGLYPRVTKGMLLDADKIRKLSDHFREQQKQHAPGTESAVSSRSVRKISSTEVTERPKRARAERNISFINKLVQQKAEEKGSAKMTAVSTDTKITTPTPAPSKKIVQIKKTAPSAETPEAIPEPTPATPVKKAAAKKTVARKPATKEKKATPAAAKKIAAEPATKTKQIDNESSEVAAPVADKPKPVPHHLEALLNKQEEHKKQREEKERLLKEAIIENKRKKEEAPKETPASTAAPNKKAKGSTLTLDKKALDSRRRKHKQNISRSEARKKTSENQHVFQKPTAPVVREIKIPDAISVEKLANETALKTGVIIRKLMEHGMSVTANELLDKETAWIIVEELGHTPVDALVDDSEALLLKRDVVGNDLQPRAPVVTVMGHVDHGKTSLLDFIRQSRVASGEAGGITQHIGAYRVETTIGPVTFLDTPGHALFSQMRSRGAKITDLVVLVVAADDGVKPQTIEAINHAKSAGVPLIVAANKIDKPEADLERVKRELSTHDVLPEDWGGDTIIIPVSAATGEGVDKLLEALAMQTELLELKAAMDVPAAGVIVEARVDKGRGIVATLIVTRGVLKRGDSFLCGTESGRIRTMWDIANPKLETAPPSMPVEIQGLPGIPEAGTELIVVEDERVAREVADMRQEKVRMHKMVSRRLPLGSAADKATLLLDAANTINEWKELNVVVKADVEGSREALIAAFTAIAGKNAGVKIIHSAVGTVTESDIYLAQTGNGVIVAFNVRPDSRARKIAESRGVKIIVGNVVYELVEQVRAAVLGLLPPIVEETITGTAKVQSVFNITKIGNIAGCMVEEGVVRAKAPVRLLRDGVPVYTGNISSLYHFKNQAAEIRTGSECGIGISRFNDIKVGDVIEALERTETAPEL